MFKFLIFKIMAHIASLTKTKAFFAKLFLKIDGKLPEFLGKKFKIVYICGSCGKSTTIAQTASILRNTGSVVIARKGENRVGEILVAILKKYPLFDADKNCYAVFEVEADDLQEVLDVITPSVITVTNVFEDKDPDGGIYEKLTFACEKLENTVFVLNGDEPLLFGFAEGNRRFYYGFRNNPSFPGSNETDEVAKICKDCGNPYKYIYNTYGHLGNYSCDACGKTRPQLALGVDEVYSINESGSEVSFDGLKIFVPLAGGSNIYNALCAATVSGAVGVGPDDIKEGIEKLHSIPGVQETVVVDTKELRLISVGSALDFTESINAILPDANIVYIACLLDKKDIRWIDNVPFEKFNHLNYHGILVGGSGCKEMSQRLENAGLDIAKFMICDDFESFIYSIRTNVIGKTYVFASKKLMRSIRHNLHKKRYI